MTYMIFSDNFRWLLKLFLFIQFISLLLNFLESALWIEVSWEIFLLKFKNERFQI